MKRKSLFLIVTALLSSVQIFGAESEAAQKEEKISKTRKTRLPIDLFEEQPPAKRKKGVVFLEEPLVVPISLNKKTRERRLKSIEKRNKQAEKNYQEQAEEEQRQYKQEEKELNEEEILWKNIQRECLKGRGMVRFKSETVVNPFVHAGYYAKKELEEL